MTTSPAPLQIATAGDGFVVRVPLPAGRSLVLRSSVGWPSGGPSACDVTTWPDDAVVVEELPVLEVRRHGPTVDVVLARQVRGWCQFTLGPSGVDERGSYVTDDEVVWWQDAAAISSAPPRQRLATARERGIEQLEVVVDTREQAHWTFADRDVQLVHDKLDCGDYAVRIDGLVVAVVERKKQSDFTSGLMRGRALPQLAALSRLPRAAVVVESSYHRCLRSKRITRKRLADLVATAQASYPSVPTVFAGSRDAAEEWTWHFLAASLSHARAELTAFPVSGPEVGP